MKTYIPEDGIHRCENLKSYIALTGWALSQRCNVLPVRYKLGLDIPEDGLGTCSSLVSSLADLGS
jgi:hypothetical protein